MEKVNKKDLKKIEVILESDINAFARIVDLLTMLSISPIHLELGSTEQGNYRLTVFLQANGTDLMFYQRFKQKLSAFDFVYELSEEESDK
jgi:hypothetical protein